MIPPSSQRRSPWLRPLLLALGLSVGLSAILAYFNSLNPTPEETVRFTREKIAESLKEPLQRIEFPTTVKLNFTSGPPLDLTPVYTIEWELQHKMEKLFQSYRPDYGAFVALDATTGKVLALTSYSSKPHDLGHLALRASYPAASLFKIVTAAAAIDSNKAHSNTVIEFNGGYHTLYRRNVTELKRNRWMREMTMKEAFAKSVNTVFAKIGMFLLDPTDFRHYAKKFRFNDAIASDVPIHSGTFIIPAENSWALAEIASGFNRYVTMSPFQGAMMASAIVNDGLMMEPYLIDKLNTSDGSTVYEAAAIPAPLSITKESAEELRSLMRETILTGTSRKSFRTFVRSRTLETIEVGGKTGSLTGTSPKGKYDWYVGYASFNDRKIAMAALTINEKTWKVKSSFVSRYFVEQYFSQLKKQISHR